MAERTQITTVDDIDGSTDDVLTSFLMSRSTICASKETPSNRPFLKTGISDLVGGLYGGNIGFTGGHVERLASWIENNS